MVCFCAPGYALDQDNSTCLPRGEWATGSDRKKRELESSFFRTCSLSARLSGPVKVPCGRPQIHFSPRVINGLVCPKGHCPWQVNVQPRWRKDDHVITSLANASPSMRCLEICVI